jgi:hypothetical protein
MFRSSRVSIVIGVASMLMPTIVCAQSFGDILKDAVSRRATEMAEEAIDKGLDTAEEAVQCVVTDQQCIERAQQAGDEVVLINNEGKPLPPDQSTNPEASDGAPMRSGTPAGVDRFTSIIERAPESTVVNGYVVNNRRVAVQKELSARPPTYDELGVRVPKGARLELETTARQIAQYHPYWRIYEYAIEMPEADLIRFFVDQGLTIEPSGRKLHFSRPAGNGEDFIDNLQRPVEGFRIWRVPRNASARMP